MEALLADAGLEPVERGEVPVVWRHADVEDTILSLLCSAGGARAMDAVGEDAVRAALAPAIAPFVAGRRERVHEQRVPLRRREGRMTEIHHIGYVVEDLQAAIPQAIATLGTGPFFLIEHMTFDETTYRGGPREYDHSSGFAALPGGLLVELTQVHGAQPPELREALGGRPGIGHVGYVVDDQAAEVARLEAAGLRAFHTGRTGPGVRGLAGVRLARPPRRGAAERAAAARVLQRRSARRPRAGTAATRSGAVADVVVIGYGPAGAAAAIAAHDAGAERAWCWRRPAPAAATAATRAASCSTRRRPPTTSTR